MSQPSDPRALAAEATQYLANARFHATPLAPSAATFIYKLASSLTATLERAEMAEAKASVIGGEACLENRAAGEGPCGACAICCKELREQIDTLKAQEQRLLAAVEAEPEYPGDIPDKLWDELQGNRAAMCKALQLTVKITKEGIIRRIRENNVLV